MPTQEVIARSARTYADRSDLPPEAVALMLSAPIRPKPASDVRFQARVAFYAGAGVGTIVATAADRPESRLFKETLP